MTVKHITFALWFTNEMRKQGLHQSELARRLGVARNNVSTYATGRAIPTGQTRIKLARIFGVTPAEVDRMAQPRRGSLPA